MAIGGKEIRQSAEELKRKGKLTESGLQIASQYGFKVHSITAHGHIGLGQC